MKKLISVVLIFSICSLSVFRFPKPVYAQTGSEWDNEGDRLTERNFLITVAVMCGAYQVVDWLIKHDKKTHNAKDWKHFSDYYNSKIGKWTFDDMLRELGKPTEETIGDSVRIAVYHQLGGYVGNTTFTFSKETKVLLQWNLR